MSALGDRIIEAGPYTAERDHRIPVELDAEEWNALRDELIALRARAAYVSQVAHNATVMHSDGVPPEALRWPPADPITVSDVTKRPDGWHVTVGTVFGMPPGTRAELVDGELRVYQDSPAAVQPPPDAMAVVGGDRDAYRWKPGEWRGLAPVDAAPCGTCGLPFTDAAVETRRCACVDGVPPVKGGLRLCPVCQSVLIGPDLVECTACAGAEDAAAKRAADQ